MIHQYLLMCPNPFTFNSLIIGIPFGVITFIIVQIMMYRDFYQPKKHLLNNFAFYLLPLFFSLSVIVIWFYLLHLLVIGLIIYIFKGFLTPLLEMWFNVIESLSNKYDSIKK